nr:hypothetical protein [Mesorhizobium tamadayense]
MRHRRPYLSNHEIGAVRGKTVDEAVGSQRLDAMGQAEGAMKAPPPSIVSTLAVDRHFDQALDLLRQHPGHRLR